MAANVRIPVRIKSEVVERNGEQYVQIKNINVSFHILRDFKMNTKFHTLIPDMLKATVNEQANSNWKQFKPLVEAQLEEYIAKIVHETLFPIWENVAIKDFFCD